MGEKQRVYAEAVKRFESAKKAMIEVEHAFLRRKGRPEASLDEIDDDAAFDSLMIELYENPEVVDLAEDVQEKRRDMRAAEIALIDYALSMVPEDVRETLHEGVRTQIMIRQKVIDSIMNHANV
ncbi:MAG: hypothetical protein SOR83_12160 [Butyricicoccus pullicaecorum]|nr:hypothetical protein [Butyricicoccus pullicaecorum]